MKFFNKHYSFCWPHITGLITSMCIVLIFFMHFFPMQKKGKLALVFIIDQLSYATLQKIRPHLTGGINSLLQKGTCYTHAYFPYAATATGPGHATLSTGTLPNIHGIIDNSWHDQHNTKIVCDADNPEQTAVFSAEGLYSYGKSAHHLQVDTISDQLLSACSESVCYAISVKSRAAIMTAGRLGKAFWFDKKLGNFTSSKAYFPQMPAWAVEFNQQQHPSGTISWNLLYPADSDAYRCTTIDYSAARQPPRIDSAHPPLFHGHKKFTYMPQSNEHVLKFAQTCIRNTVDDRTKNMLFWISLSGPDIVGHVYGPQSLEYIDTLYHIDRYLESFLQWIQTTFNDYDILYILTADHGSTPIPEVMHKQGFTCAQRINTPQLEKEINGYLEERHSIPDIVQLIDPPSLYVNTQLFNTLAADHKTTILQDIKEYLMQKPYINNIWSDGQILQHGAAVVPVNIQDYFYNSFYPSRSGQLLICHKPYCLMSKHLLGTSHLSPYEYTTHVPLCICHTAYTTTSCHEWVSLSQVAPSLAHFFGIQKPCACLYKPLP